jgi:hypothetical protein
MATTTLLTLQSLAEHPRVQEVRRSLASSQEEFARVEAQADAAQEELTRMEQAAADGNRDDKRLRAAREQASHWQGELRIASLRWTAARQNAEAIERDAADEWLQQLQEAHRAAIRKLDAALQQVRVLSHAATALEMASESLPRRNWLRDPGVGLPRLSWAREFGSATTTLADTRYELWRAYCRSNGIHFE